MEETRALMTEETLRYLTSLFIATGSPRKVAPLFFPDRPKGYSQIIHVLGTLALNVVKGERARREGDLIRAAFFDGYVYELLHHLPPFAVDMAKRIVAGERVVELT